MMRTAFDPTSDGALSAFADGELPPRLARRVAAELRRRPELAERLCDYWRREAALIRAFETTAGATPALALPRPARRRRGLLVSSSAAGLLAVSVGAVLLWPSTAPRSSAATLTRDILEAYAAPVARRASTGTPTASPSPLTGLGLDYTGRHRVRVGGRRFNEYRYRDGRGHELALYRLPRQQDAADGWLRVSEAHTTRVPMVRWSQGPYSYVLVGGDRSLALARLALRIQRQLTGPRAAADGASPTPPTPPEGRSPARPANAPTRARHSDTDPIDYARPARTSDM